MTVTASVNISAVIPESQMPVSPRSSGRVRMMDTWNTSVLRNEISAESGPLFSAVKKEEPKIFIPQIRNDMAQIRNPWQVISKRVLS